MFYKTFIVAAVLCVVSALSKRDSHSASSHSVVHPGHAHEHHGSHHAENHAPAISSQSIFIHHSGGEHGGGQGDDGHHGHEEEHHGHAKYEFEYKVEEPHTGDHKYQKESRDGDKVVGLYHLVQPDGKLRTVKYHADKHSGFNADVMYSGHHAAPASHHHH